MALVLTLKTGQDFYVADTQVFVGRVVHERHFYLEVPSSKSSYEVTDQEAVEMREVPDVFFSAGDRSAPNLVRVAIDAPQEIAIMRGDKRRNESHGTLTSGAAVLVEDRRKRSKW